MSDLYQYSIELIHRSQAPSGAYVASPNFDSYRYCWLRDGSFIAHAMDRVGEHESAGAFFRWAERAIRRHAGSVERALDRMASGEPLGPGDYLPTRYTLDGMVVTEQWWDFQLDGYGTWLWAAGEHVRLSGDRSMARELADSVAIVVRYLTHLWPLPNYDCWEEHSTYQHSYTLAAIYAGLRAAGVFGIGGLQEVSMAIRGVVLREGTRHGHLVKAFQPAQAPARVLAEDTPVFHDSGSETAITDGVDASLLGVSTPYRLLSPADPVMRATVTRIERDLYRPGGGVYRYRGDTYYGGGEWVLLAAWLGWYYAEAGEIVRAQELQQWVEAQADADGNLPEQVLERPLAPERLAEWESRWGPIATPLTWSHAMYLILSQAVAAG